MVRSSSIEITKEELFHETDKLLQSFDLQKFDCIGVELLEEDLLFLARSIYPDSDHDVEAYLYGSRMTGLAKRDTDVDIYMDIDGTFGGSISEDVDEQVERVERFQDAMNYDFEQKFEVIVALKDCQVPILRFKHMSTGLRCDLSFRSGMSYRSGQLVKFYLDWDPRVKYVVTGVKFFMKKYGFAGPLLFNSCAQVWLALFFLMQKGIEVIPPLLSFRRMAAETSTKPPANHSIVECWNCTVPEVGGSYRRNWIENKCKLSGEELLVKFFTFYSSLPSLRNEFVLTTYNGMITKKKRVFLHPRRSIRRFSERYRVAKGTTKLNAIRKKYAVNVEGRFYLQDPFDQMKNLTKMKSAKVSSDRMVEFVKYCKQMARNMNY